MNAHALAAIAGAQVGILVLLGAAAARARPARWMRRRPPARPLGGIPAPLLLPLTLRLALAALGFFLGAALPLAARRPASPLLALAGAALFSLAPELWRGYRTRSRQEAILRALPGTIDLLTVCSVSGLNLTQSLEAVAEAEPGELGDELRQALRLVQAGRTVPFALRHMADRLQVPEVTSLANAVVLTESLGTPVADLFRTQAAAVRTQRRRRSEEAVGKLPMKFSLISVFLILPSLFILTILPNVLGFMDSGW